MKSLMISAAVVAAFFVAVLTMPWMEVEKDGDDLVIITTPEMAISKDEDGETEVGLQLDDAELQVRRVGDAMAIAGFAKELVR